MYVYEVCTRLTPSSPQKAVAKKVWAENEAKYLAMQTELDVDGAGEDTGDRDGEGDEDEAGNGGAVDDEVNEAAEEGTAQHASCHTDAEAGTVQHASCRHATVIYCAQDLCVSYLPCAHHST